MPRDRDTYTFQVTFTRSLSADLGVLSDENSDTTSRKTRDELVQQLRTELQAAYDHPDVAPDGSFKIDSITIDGETYQA